MKVLGLARFHIMWILLCASGVSHDKEVVEVY